jgi:tetratricopeptide (TPR) repeat protein
LVASLILLAIALAVTFGPVRNFQLLTLWDDNVNVLNNPGLNPPSWEGVAKFWREPYVLLYVPVTYTVLAAEATLAYHPASPPGQRFDPHVFHIANLVWHALSCSLVLLILRQLLGPGWPPLAGALFYALHPLQVETVAWVTETKGLVSATFGWSAVLLYLIATRMIAAGRDPDNSAPSPALLTARTITLFVLALLCFALSLLAKPTAVILPLMVICIDLLWREERLRITCIRVAPALALTAAILLLTRSLQPPEVIPSAAPLWARPLVAGHALAMYLFKLVLPYPLCVDYGYTPTVVMRSAGWWAWIMPVAVTLFFAFSPHHRRWLCAWGIFVVGLLPVLGFIPFRFQEFSTIADRYVYLAMLGPALGVAYLLSLIEAAWAWGLAVASLLGLAWLSHAQTAHWVDDETVFRHVLEVNPASYLAHTQLGTLAGQQQDGNAAAGHYVEAITLNPRAEIARNNLANLLVRSGRFDEAIAQYRELLEISPKNLEFRCNLALALAQAGQLDEAQREIQIVLQEHPQHALALNTWADILVRQNRLDQAIEVLQEAFAAQPESGSNLANLAGLLVQQGRTGEAIEVYEIAARLHPLTADAELNFGLILLMAGKASRALEAFDRAAQLDVSRPEPHFHAARAQFLLGEHELGLQRLAQGYALNPHWPPLLATWARLLATHPNDKFRDGNRALALAQQVTQATRFEDPEALLILADAQAETGRFEDAIRTAEQALRLARAQQRQSILNAGERRLSAYRQKLPWREDPRTSVAP